MIAQDPYRCKSNDPLAESGRLNFSSMLSTLVKPAQRDVPTSLMASGTPLQACPKMPALLASCTH